MDYLLAGMRFNTILRYEQMPGNIFLQEELLNHGIIYPKK